MTMLALRPLSEIAADILAQWKGNVPLALKQSVASMAYLGGVQNERSYRIVSDVRTALKTWRSTRAAEIKRELETMMAHYRAVA